MTRLIGTVMAVALLVSVAPALAGDQQQYRTRPDARLAASCCWPRGPNGEARG